MDLCYNRSDMEEVDNRLLQPVAEIEEGKSPIGNQRAILIGGIALVILLMAGTVAAVIAMVQHPVQTETIRDIVIIFMAVESLIIGVTLILLLVQLARLTALLQNEIRPILDSTNETLSTLKGTTTFLSDNLVKPVMKANSTFSALRQAATLVGRKSKRTDNT